ncbi:MAG: DEAD/DEAH box helicase [Ruminococcaceae bacterium]|nr:DEAD/DEAH box helicase [Oscillospiraceae bacterium]
MPIPRSLIRRLTENNAVYADALSLALTDFFYEIQPTEFDGFFHVFARFSDGASAALQIDNISEAIESFSCTCDSPHPEDGACKHVAALLLKTENDFFSDSFARTGSPQPQPAETAPMLRALMSSRAASLKASAARRAGAEKALILPHLQLDEEGARLSFKIGCKKAYVVKDLGELYNAIKNQVTAPCGKADSFFYAPESFTDKPLVQFFMEYYPLCADEFNPKTMLLTPAALDKFTALYENRKLCSSAQTLTFLPQSPSFSLHVRRAKDFYRLSLSRTDFTLIHGQNRLYIKENDILYLCGREFMESCGELLACFVSGSERPCVHASDMRAFYSMVLRPASRFISIKAENRDFVPPPLKTKVYLDIDKKKKVSAKTEFCYGNDSYNAFDPNRDLNSVWDIEGETAVEELIRTYFPDVEKEPGLASFSFDEELLFALIAEGIPALREHATLLISTELRSVRIRSLETPRMGVRLESDLLQLTFSADDLSPQVLSAALSAYRQKKKYIRLENGTFLTLESDAIKALNTVTESLGLSGNDLKKRDLAVPLYRSLYIDEISGLQLETDSSFRKMAKRFKQLDEESLLPPAELSGILRDYQKFGFRWLSLLSSYGFGGILADDMGLGKTLQILTLLQAFKEKEGRLSALVVCPASLVLNWENEIRHFTPSLSSCCIIGTGAERISLLKNAKQYNICITSYDLLKRDLEHYGDMAFDFEIIDEAQYIKNHNTLNAKTVKAVSAKTRFALTGTPIENSLAELWSIFDYLMPGYLYRYSKFRRVFEVPIVKENDAAALAELKKLTTPFILRRLKRDVLKELPPKTETILYTNLAQEQRTLYAANLASMQKELSEQLEVGISGKGRMIVLSMLTRLRQLCCDPSLVYEGYKEESAKLELCMELVESSVNSGHKLLIFSQFTSMLAILEKRLRHKKIPYYLIEGATKKEERTAMVNAFNQDDTPVFLISLKAGGTGLNLTGADMVIHYDPWWNLSAQNQATDRAHRIGQKNSVQVYKLIAKDTVEEKILTLAAKKQALAEHVLPDENTLLAGMTKEELLDLFKS